jgi:cytochrome c oxidase subunit II
MLTKIKVVPEEDFNNWYADIGKQAIKTAGSETSVDQNDSVPPAAAGERLAKIHGCFSCHSTDGSKLVGPSLKGVFGHQVTVITDGKEREITADDEYIRRSILKPAADVVKGFDPIMPSQEGQLTEEELVALIQYIKGLK